MADDLNEKFIGLLGSFLIFSQSALAMIWKLTLIIWPVLLILALTITILIARYRIDRRNQKGKF